LSPSSTLLWHLHDMWPELRLPGGALFSKKWSTRIGRRLARAEPTMRVRIARDELRRLRELTLAINQLEREITALVEQIAPQLLAEPGFGPLIAAKLVGEIAGAQRFATAAKLAAAAGLRRSPPAPGTRNATGSTRAATARSTPPFTASSSPARAVTRRRATTSNGEAAKARAPAKRSAASSATSPAASGDSSKPPHPENAPASINSLT
jgi:transposase